MAPSLVGLGSLLVDRGRPADAEPLLRQTLDLWRRHPERPESISLAENVLGHSLTAAGELDEAAAPLTRSKPVLESFYGAGHRVTERARARDRLAALCRAAGGAAGACLEAALHVG